MTGLNADSDDPRQEIYRLIERAGGRKGLEALRDIFTGRLHRRPDDFDATRALRLVTAKLQQTSYGEQVVTTSS
jgi:hypothetical protein